MSKKLSSDLLFVTVWTLLTATFVLTPVLSESYIRTILGIPMVLFIPGYVLIAALFIKKADLESVERIALSFGLSIAVVPLLGLILNFTFGIRLIPILLSLVIWTIALIIITEYRRQKVSKEERFTVIYNPIQSIKTELKEPMTKTDKILTIILILTAIIAVGMIYYVITTPKIGEKFTEFYVLDSNGKADNYQTQLKIGEDATYLLGISNHEYGVVNYTLNIAMNNDTLITQDIMLAHNQTWEQNTIIQTKIVGTNMKLEFLLFKEGNFTEPYRNLHIWVNSS